MNELQTLFKKSENELTRFQRFLIAPILIALAVLFFRPSSVPNVEPWVLDLLLAIAFVGYFGFLTNPSIVALRVATNAVMVLGFVRSLGYAVDGLWSPASVWTITAAFGIFTHFYLRDRIRYE